MKVQNRSPEFLALEILLLSRIESFEQTLVEGYDRKFEYFKFDQLNVVCVYFSDLGK